MHTIASANVFKKLPALKKQKFSLNHFKLLRSTAGLSYRWTSRRSICIGFFRAEAPMGRPIGTLSQFSHDLINCSQNTRLNSVILGLSLKKQSWQALQQIS